MKEYLPSLQLRQKWLKPERNIKENDLVLVMNENSPRHAWPLARVTKVYKSDDQLVRSVQVKTRNSLLDRPVNKLCLLEEAQD